MSDFYSVTMTRKQLISEYDKHGKLIGTREELMPITFNDLPGATAESYKTAFPDANVVITKQIASADDRFKPSKWKMERRLKDDDGKVDAKQPNAVKPEEFGTATQDYSTLVNKMVKGEE
jgi:hypothetical protein